MFNNLRRWFFRILFGKKLSRKAFDMVLTDAIDVISDKLDGGFTNFKEITSVHYTAQAYDLLMNNPFLLAIVLDTKKESNVIESSYTWAKELGWSEEEIREMGLFSLLHPSDVDRTIDAYEDVEKIAGQDVFYNRYRCKYQTHASFKSNEDYYVWIAWSIKTNYSNKDRYRLSVARVIPHCDPLFNYLQEEYATFQS